jgi:DNA transposition AAA+ family ATPase
MSEQNEQVPFVVTKGYQLFADLCDACRRFRSIGVGYGPPGTGKVRRTTA